MKLGEALAAVRHALDTLVRAAREEDYRDGFADGNAAGFRDGVDHVSNETGRATPTD
jgi:hypothetical protein